jgi:phage-related minor tail protein
VPLLVWVAAAVMAALLSAAGGTVLGYKYGKREVESAWAKEKVAYVEAAQLAVRRIEATRRILNDELEKQSNDFTAQMRRQKAAVDAGRRELDRLRHAIAATGNRPVSSVAEAGPAIDGGASIAGELLGECAAEYLALGEESGRLAAQLTALQGYVRSLHRNQE